MFHAVLVQSSLSTHKMKIFCWLVFVCSGHQECTFIVKDATGIVIGPFAGAWDVLLRAMNLALGDLAQEHRARVLPER